ncbi:hypothetical protein AGLY_007302 [Aphis glycines]|uniref:Uncharacterized protein n=1 Tax=Aphis glycines TaxID=307491 RepID=A0A6G0TP94_APHGL|nr:hypothetical protein AGLY_007302 [Aphis glycines]
MPEYEKDIIFFPIENSKISTTNNKIKNKFMVRLGVRLCNFVFISVHHRYNINYQIFLRFVLKNKLLSCWILKYRSLIECAYIIITSHLLLYCTYILYIPLYFSMTHTKQHSSYCVPQIFRTLFIPDPDNTNCHSTYVFNVSAVATMFDFFSLAKTHKVNLSLMLRVVSSRKFDLLGTWDQKQFTILFKQSDGKIENDLRLAGVNNEEVGSRTYEDTYGLSEKGYKLIILRFKEIDINDK